VTRILLIDDHTLLRESLVRFLAEEPSLLVVGHCATIPEARAILKETAVDLILLDYDLGAEPGTHLLHFLRATANPARVLMLTAGMNHSATLTALNNGAAGIVLKQTGTRELLDAIRVVVSGGAWWPPETLAAEPQKVEPRTLTERQRLVLRAILDGLANKEIAARLDVSETAIKASIQELFAKAGVRTRAQLVRAALERYPTTWLP
jgi:DNA-binding NarL/FixJ family response regulator